MAITSYAEALSRIASGQDTSGSSIPSYMTASDTLNIANGNETFVDSALNAIDNVPKFIGTSIISGANQLYNIPTDIGNLFGADFERSDTGELIASLDSNLGAFYKENQTYVDLVGFMMSSLVPGLGAIKVLNAGQKNLRAAIATGSFGDNTGVALGLLSNSIKAPALEKALLEVTTNSSAASILNGNALRAVAGGFGQNALEALAFETAVAATLFKSPILENQDFGDFATNVAFGAGVFGLIGGTIDATRISFSLKRAADTAAVEARPWTSVAEPAAASTSYDKVVLDFEQLNNIPPIPTNVGASRQAFLESASKSKRTTLENRIRGELGVLSNGDQDVARALFNAFKVTKAEREFIGPLEAAKFEVQQAAFIGLVDSTKLGVTSKIAARSEKLQARAISGKATAKETEELAASDITVKYVKMWGEDTGRITPEKPTVISLVDTLKGKQKIKVTPSGVTAGQKKFPFDLKFNKVGKGTAWNILRADTFEAQARYMWAQKLAPFKPTASKPLTVNVNDLPLMEKVMLEVTDPEALANVKFTGLDKGEVIGTSLRDFIGDKKISLANRLLAIRGEKAGTAGLIQDEIAAITNVRSSLLNGEVLKDSTSAYALDDMLAMQSYAQNYNKQLVKQGARKEKEGIVDIWNVPQHIKLTYDSKPFEGLDNFVIENMVILKEQQKLYQEGTARAAAVPLGKFYEQLPEINSGRVFSGAVPSGAGAGFFKSASGGYGSLASAVEQAGNVTSRAITAAKDGAREVLEPLLYKLGNNQQAAIEWSTISAEVRNIDGIYGLNAAGDALEPLDIIRWKQAAEEATAAGTAVPKRPTLANPAMKPRIELKTQEVRDLTKAHIEVNGARTASLAGIRTAQGTQFNRAADAFYPIPVNPKDFPNFAIVIDESVTSGNQSRTLFATTGEELQQMATKLEQNPQLKVLFKDDAEEYFKSIGQFSYEKTLSNNYLDTAVHRTGTSSPFLPATDPTKITSDFLNWHLERESGLVREAVTSKYEVQFRELEALGRGVGKADASKFGKIRDKLGIPDSITNPFNDYVNTALALRKNESYPWWQWTNTMADKTVTTTLMKATAVMETAKTPEQLLEVNKMLEKAGYSGAKYDASMEVFANAQPARGALTTVVQKANSIIATVVIRWDMLNAATNAVSANVLLGSETASLTRLINSGGEGAQASWNVLTKINVPGTDKVIFSPQKLIANAMLKFNRTSDDMKFYKENGFATSISDQYRSTLEDLTFNPKKSVGFWDFKINERHAKLRVLADKGEQITGNRLAEEFNRFVAADVMKQMTDVAISRGLMGAREQLAYINTFVNRTQGNYLAAQRPMLFQGAIGQAVGLFQTYQFNLMQQLLRHTGEGHAKDAMTLLALQGTIHGMNGLPAFNAINTHLVGTASGNSTHKDAYDAVYGVAGKQAGDWLMYGAASNFLGLIDPDLKINLYTRGDINPRHVTIIPTDPASIPLIQATGRVLGNLFQTAGKLAAGGDVTTTILQGLEHNSLSRPLAGLAQTLQGFDNPLAASYSTSKRGNVIASNDLLSLTNLGRLAGGKPFDEAIAIDATYRYQAYEAKDGKARMALGQAIKSTMIAGQNPTQDQINNFAEDYAKIGGRQKDFSRWFTQLYKTANLSQAAEIQKSLTNPFAESMQLLMGGREVRDFTAD